MELRRLHYFLAVAEELNFSRAAKRLHVSQSSLSQQIKALEEELGATLFDRDRHSVRLTAAGRAFLDPARRLSAAADESVTVVRRAGSNVQRLAVGMGYGLFSITTPIRAFRESHPGVQVVLREMSSSDVQQQVRSGELDVGICRGPKQVPELECRTAGRQRLVLWIPASHPLADEDPVPLVRFREERFLIFPRHLSPTIYDTIVGACISGGFTPRLEEIPGATPYQLLAAVSSGAGVCVGIDLPGLDLRSLHVAARRLLDLLPEIDVIICWLCGELPQHVREFLALIT